MKTTNMLLLAACSFLASCDDNSDASLPEMQPGNLTGSTDFFRRNAAAPQTFQVDGVAGGTITGAKGTVVIIPSNAFVDDNNNPMNGSVDIQLREIYSKKDMLFSHIGTTSYGWPLYSAGMIRVEANVNGMPVRFASGKYYVARIPAESLDYNMGIFTGELNTDGSMNWVADSNFNPNPVLGFDSMSLPNCYLFGDTTTKWINIDAFNYSPDITITLNTLNNPNPDSTYAFLWLTGFNSLCGIGIGGIGSYTYNRAKSLPVSLIAFTVSNGHLYSGILTLPSLAPNANYSITLRQTPEQAFKDSVAALN